MSDKGSYGHNNDRLQVKTVDVKDILTQLGISFTDLSLAELLQARPDVGMLVNPLGRKEAAES